MPKAARVALAIGLSSISVGVCSNRLAAQTPALFASHDLLQLTLEAPIEQVIRAARGDRDDAEHPGVLHAGDRAIPIRLSAFGKSRLRVCKLPPLRITLDSSEAAGTAFDGEETVWLVTHCAAFDGSERFVLLEYLVYRMYGLVTEPALSVRLAEIQYRDTSSRARPKPGLAFFVEDINRAAARHGLEWLTIERQRLDDLDRPELSLLSFFQFMIGNTDWSVLRGPEGERCCHNVAVLGDPASGSRHLLPFDFDCSGVVNAPYAQPSVRLGISDVTQRRYRGFCANSEHLPKSIARLQGLKLQIEGLLADPSLPHSRARATAGKYISQFFRIIRKPKKVEKQIRRRCRGAD
jgi:hypothetical protein